MGQMDKCQCEDWTTEDVEKWLREKGFPDYIITIFYNQCIDGKTLLFLVKEDPIMTNTCTELSVKPTDIACLSKEMIELYYLAETLPTVMQSCRKSVEKIITSMMSIMNRSFIDVICQFGSDTHTVIVRRYNLDQFRTHEVKNAIQAKTGINQHAMNLFQEPEDPTLSMRDNSQPLPDQGLFSFAPNKPLYLMVRDPCIFKHNNEQWETIGPDYDKDALAPDTSTIRKNITTLYTNRTFVHGMPRTRSLLKKGLHQFSVVMHELDPTWDYDMRTWFGVIREEHVDCPEGVFLSDPATVSSSQITTDTDVHLKFESGPQIAHFIRLHGVVPKDTILTLEMDVDLGVLRLYMNGKFIRERKCYKRRNRIGKWKFILNISHPCRLCICPTPELEDRFNVYNDQERQRKRASESVVARCQY